MAIAGLRRARHRIRPGFLGRRTGAITFTWLPIERGALRRSLRIVAMIGASPLMDSVSRRFRKR